ncbi:hypothetical protein [Thalassolituus maritimus]|uniref:Uncharacterized protein n=1 Tax=Thalassolituus maritimus TaxID=484498 RepID=A0ABP9ZZ22_9GAMM
MKRRYPVTASILIVALSFVDFSARLDFRLVNSSLSCQLRNPNAGSEVSVADIGQLANRGALYYLNSEDYKWLAVPRNFYNSEVFDYEAMTFAGELIEVNRSLPERLVGQSSGYYYVFDSPEGKVLIMSGMIDCSG